MVKRVENTIEQFKGIKNDENSKQVPWDYFYKIKNYNFPSAGTKGLAKILMPEQILQMTDEESIDGLFEYRYLDTSGDLQTEYIVCTNGKIIKTDLVSTETELKPGLTAGKVSFAVMNDKLFIANGLDYVQVYYGSKGIVAEMGAPVAEEGAAGALTGDYYYAMTYVTSGGEEIIGSVSNTITVAAKRITLTLPLGYTGVTDRYLYRTEAGGTTLKKLAELGDNTTLTYSDNNADGVLGATISATNNGLPKPYHLAVLNQMLFGAKVDNYPTQCFATNPNIEVWDAANYIDIANYGNDNTAIEGIGIDFSNILVGTSKNIYLLSYDSTSDVHTPLPTRASIGIKSGYSVVTIPASGEFEGGMMFVSSENDVRVMAGLRKLDVATSFDNIQTDDWGQNIRGDLDTALATTSNIHAEYYDHKYHLVIGSTKYVFDIRVKGWTEHYIKSASYTSTPIVLAVLNNLLYNGQADGWIELEYSTQTYKTENVEAYLESPHIAVNDKFKILEAMKLWFVPSTSNSITVTVYTDDNSTASTSLTFSVLANATFTVKGGAYNPTYFSATYFDTDATGMDYRTININQALRWFKYCISNTVGNISIQGVTLIGQELYNKES